MQILTAEMILNEDHNLTTAEKIKKVCDSLKIFLQTKNKNYGDSAIKPVRIFSGEIPVSGINVRIDDKLSRISNSEILRKNDIVDLTGYLILLCIQNDWLDFQDLID